MNVDGVCDPDLITLLNEAHSHNIQVYGLFASSDAEFSEQDMVGDLNLFNSNCEGVLFDGAAVNNEYFTSIKACGVGNEAAQQTLLDDLSTTASNASPLPLHFSISWNWWCCDCGTDTQRFLEWNGVTKNVVGHMIDIVDSVDVQVAWNVGSTMTNRATNAYGYWNANKFGQTSTTALYVLAYTNPNSDCRLSFSPHLQGSTTVSDLCATGDRTEEGMFTAFSEIQSSLSNAVGAIHYMDGVYSSGMPGWPRHAATVTSAPTPAPGPACFSGQNSIEVRGKGLISMSDLQIGDHIRTCSGDFSLVYSFFHKHKDLQTEYLRIVTTNNQVLEVTEDHFVFVNGEVVRAADLDVGDPLAVGRAVLAIERHQSRKGLYAPVTLTGDLVVSGACVSSYVALWKYNVPSLQNWATHMGMSIVRLMCSNSSGCEGETYDDETGFATRYVHQIAFIAWLEAIGGQTGTLLITLFGAPFLGVLYVVDRAWSSKLMSATTVLVVVVMMVWLAHKQLGQKLKPLPTGSSGPLEE